MGLAIQVSSLCYMIPASLGSATTIRVANLLGAGHGHQANVTVQVSSCIVFVLTLVLGGALCLLRDLVARAFTEDAIIRHATAVVLPAVAASFLGKQCHSTESGAYHKGESTDGSFQQIC